MMGKKLKQYSLPKSLMSFVLLWTMLSLSSCASQQAAQQLNQEGSSEYVILLHGLGRNNLAMWLLASRLEDAGFHVHRVGYDSFNTSIPEIEEGIAEQIDSYASSVSGTIHFVGHSMGGLLIRAYLEDHILPTMGRTVLIGTPNKGTPVADRVKGNWLLEAFNSPAEKLGTKDSFPLSLEQPYYPVGVIAGRVDSCIADYFIPGENDGLVPVESTKVCNMSDFIVVDSGHSFLRYDKTVADQTIFFLMNGHFRRPG